MSQIKVKNFGPIKSGFAENNGFIDIRKITVFIGNQGTGKSSIAKLISTFSWLEKQLYRGNLEIKDVKNYNKFIKTYCNYHNLKNYFLPETEIEYLGNAFNFSFQDRKLNIDSRNFEAIIFNSLCIINNIPKEYFVPKIMYIPAERNFFSVVKGAEKVKGLPQSLSTFFEELERSQQELSESLTLPVGDVKLEFDKINSSLNILGQDYKLNISESSSGFQSFIPLFLVSRNIALSIGQNKDSSQSELSGEEQQRLKIEIERILSNDNLSEEVKKAALEVLSSKYKNECFLNIVEEIEQNLFPKSQKDVLYKLLEFANLTEGNTLILTTHSPYIINYLTLAIKGYQVLQKILDLPNSNLLKEQLENIVPQVSCVSDKDSIVYELTETGEIIKLSTYEGLPTDENYLNSFLAETNNLFDNLLEIEEQI
ncbi:MULTISPECIES: AAA family ATPase [unclassified Dolichospermum]|uniref:AAA family ATPase n=1 Tax=unclassified Dolichospermum TaxID=2622029 RepID=UPI001445F24F|nr:MULTISPECIES: AAA family ATPase [unclassified Dolichospermum]MBO1054352.1 ATP-binding protein [Dolichospermum sp. DET73]MTJ15958.1 ATP-binding protein [Dolichospermum sp. UHCC 0299]MTJ37752.1 ATP-binding protein [Dolichospermum sp. UHCC 0406]